MKGLEGKIKFNVVLTASKVLAFMIFGFTALYAWANKDVNILSLGVYVSSMLITGKTLMSTIKDIKNPIAPEVPTPAQ